MADDAVGSQVDDLQAECEEQVQKNRSRRQFCRFVHAALGLPAAVLAGSSGATGLSSESARIPAAVLALISAGLGSAIAFLKPEIRQRAAHARRRRPGKADRSVLRCRAARPLLRPAASVAGCFGGRLLRWPAASVAGCFGGRTLRWPDASVAGRLPLDAVHVRGSIDSPVLA